MKNMKKLVGIAMLTIALLVSMVVPTFATDITMNGAEGAEYSAYKLLNATDGGEGKFAYTLNDKYTAVLQTVTGKTEQADIVAYINDPTTDIADFADAVYAAILVADPAITADAVSVNAVFAGVEQGYYLIAETKLASDSDTYSLIILDTAGQSDITVNTKEDIPTVEKKVEEKNDTTGESSWGDSADYDIGDVINYKLTGTVSAEYASYGSYYYSFVDEMVAGLTYNKDAKVYIDGTEITDWFDIVTTENGFTATANLKEITGVNITADSEVVVEYTCTLNEDAIRGGIGNKNEVYIEYENNPSVEADGNPETPDKPDEPSESEKDVNVVFTFDAVVNKTDKDGVALEGAGFTLYKDIKGEWTAVGAEVTGVTEFEFDGLDEGKYKLVETTVPEGYNKADDVLFEIAPVYNTTTDPHTLEKLQVKNGEAVISEGDSAVFEVTLNTGLISTDVVNVSGAELPSTGGIGTTIFYIAGGVLVVAAIILLVAKKRMNAEG